MGLRPVNFVEYQACSRSKGSATPIINHKGLPYLDAITGIYADNQRCGSRRSRRPCGDEFRSFPPSAVDELVGAPGDKITVQTSDWNCALIVTPKPQKKTVDDARVRRALTLAVDRWQSAPALSKIAIVRTVGGIVFPGSPLAATKEELQQMAGTGPISEIASRGEASAKGGGGRGARIRLLNRSVDQPFKFLGIWLVDEWSKIGVKVTQRVLPTGPWFEGLSNGSFDVAIRRQLPECHQPVLDVSKYQPRSAFTEAVREF